MIVRQRTLEVTLNGQATKVETGGMIFCASNEMHGVCATCPAGFARVDRRTGTVPADLHVRQMVPPRPRQAEAVSGDHPRRRG